MISVWGKFYPGTENFEAMRAKGFLYERTLRDGFRDWVGRGYPYTFYDAFNPEARRLFWAQVERALFRRGVDAWWMDATEPDLLPTPTLDGQRAHMHPTAMGTGLARAERLLAREQPGRLRGPARRRARPARLHPDPLGLRRPAALRRRHLVGRHHLDLDGAAAQIPAGLGFSLSGLPYWTMDIGGFSVPGRFSRKDPTARGRRGVARAEHALVPVRHLLPAPRVHGESPKREMWEIGRRVAPGLPGASRSSTACATACCPTSTRWPGR